MKKKILAILLATLMTAMVLLSIPMATAVGVPLPAPDDLEITQVIMDDYILICAAMGGQYVDIDVDVKNTGDTTITEDFEVWLYINQVSYKTKKPVDDDISPDETIQVSFGDIHISRGIGGDYTLDAYINDDLDTRNYCEFEVTLFGLESKSSRNLVPHLFRMSNGKK